MTDLVPPVDLVPSLPSRIVTIDVVNEVEGAPADGVVTFTLAGDIHVAADQKIVQARAAGVRVPLVDGRGRVRLPAWSGPTRGPWGIWVRKSWAPHPYLIRVPAGSSSIDLSQITPLMEAPVTVNPEFLVTGAGVEVVEGAQWDATVSVAGGVASFVFTVPPGATPWARGSLSVSDVLDSLRLAAHEGTYKINDGSMATALGLPVSTGGNLVVEHVRGVNPSTSVARHEFTTDSNSLQFVRRSSSAGWTDWEQRWPVLSTSVEPREVPDGTDLRTLRLAEHQGRWKYGGATGAESIEGLPPVNRSALGFTLDVEHFRGTNAATSRVMHHLSLSDGTFWYSSTSAPGSAWTDWVQVGSGGGTVIDAQVTAVDVFLALGQSNMSGRGSPFGEIYGDVPDGRIWEYGSKVRTLRVASVPLDMHDENSSARLSPATSFARSWVRHVPPGTIALVVGGAHGGTGFTGAGSTWNWAEESGEWSLLAEAMSQTTEAIAAAQAQWPGATVRVRAVLWHQGENDGSMAVAANAAALDQLIGRIRAVYPDVPFILGEMSPDRPGGVAGTNPGLVHQDTPARVPGTALAHTPPDGSRDGDLSHLGRTSVEVLGQRMHDLMPAARANTTGMLQMPPPRVWAWRDGALTRAEWDPPLCRALGYVVESSTDNGSTWSDTGVTVTGRRAIIARTGVTHVRVATRAATSAPGTNLAPNPGFESGTGNVSAGSGTTISRTTAAAAVRQGTYALQVAHSGSATAQVQTLIQQEIPATTGQWVAFASYNARSTAAELCAGVAISERTESSHIAHHYTPLTPLGTAGLLQGAATVHTMQLTAATVARVRVGLVYSAAPGTWSAPDAAAIGYSDAWAIALGATQAQALAALGMTTSRPSAPVPIGAMP